MNAQSTLRPESVPDLERHAELVHTLVAWEVAFLIVGPTGRVDYASPHLAIFCGVPAGELLGREVSELPAPMDAMPIVELVWAATARRREGDRRREPYEMRVRGMGRIRLRAARLDEDRDAVIVVFEQTADAGIHDRSTLDQRKMEAIGHLAAGIAHEINTPMQYISDNTRFLQDAMTQLRERANPGDAANASEPDELEQEILAAIEDSLEGIERVTEIVQAMKMLSHPGAVGHETFDLNRIVHSSTLVTRNQWKYVADLEVDSEADSGQILVRGSPSEISQVVINLIVNAAHAIEDRRAQEGRRGKIGVRISTDDQWVTLAVSDTGCGIPEELRDHIFNPFFTTKEVGRGTGQGLSLVRAIVVDGHGGDVDFESRLGEGSTFRVRLRKA